MKIGIGIDIEKIARFSKLDDKPTLKEKFLLPQEIARTTSQKTQYYASIFVCKEAVIKAFNQAFDRLLDYKSIEIINRSKTFPECRLLNYPSLSNLKLSVSHDKDTAVGVCLIYEL